MSPLHSLDVSFLGFALFAGGLSVLLAVSAWLDTSPGRHAPHDVTLSGGALAAVAVAGLLGAPVAVLLAMLVAWAVVLFGYEVGWFGWQSRRRHRVR